MPKTVRPDHDGSHRQAFERNKKKILLSQTVCGICGRPVDKRIKYPNPLSPCIDHIIPIDRGGHPSDISNLQLAHWICNRQKGNKLISESRAAASKTAAPTRKEVNSNRMLPQSMDWTTYRAKASQP